MTTLIESIASTLWAATSTHELPNIEYDAVLALVNERLPKLLEAMRAGLVTEHEVAGAITARFETWLERRAGRQVGAGVSWWEAVVRDIEEILNSR